MRSLRFILPAVALALALPVFSSPARALEDVCPPGGQRQAKMTHVLHMDGKSVAAYAAIHCRNLGKVAFNAIGLAAARGTPLGPITGVSWVHAGEVLSLPGWRQITARHTGFVYIIGAGGISTRPFSRWANDIVAR